VRHGHRCPHTPAGSVMFMHANVLTARLEPVAVEAPAHSLTWRFLEQGDDSDDSLSRHRSRRQRRAALKPRRQLSPRRRSGGMTGDVGTKRRCGPRSTSRSPQRRADPRRGSPSALIVPVKQRDGHGVVAVGISADRRCHRGGNVDGRSSFNGGVQLPIPDVRLAAAGVTSRLLARGLTPTIADRRLEAAAAAAVGSRRRACRGRRRLRPPGVPSRRAASFVAAWLPRHG
jgi:hypothetical protein